MLQATSPWQLGSESGLGRLRVGIAWIPSVAATLVGGHIKVVSLDVLRVSLSRVLVVVACGLSAVPGSTAVLQGSARLGALRVIPLVQVLVNVVQPDVLGLVSWTGSRSLLPVPLVLESRQTVAQVLQRLGVVTRVVLFLFELLPPALPAASLVHGPVMLLGLLQKVVIGVDLIAVVIVLLGPPRFLSPISGLCLGCEGILIVQEEVVAVQVQVEVGQAIFSCLNFSQAAVLGLVPLGLARLHLQP